MTDRACRPDSRDEDEIDLMSFYGRNKFFIWHALLPPEHLFLTPAYKAAILPP